MRSDEWCEVRLGDLIQVKHGWPFRGEYFRDEPKAHLLLTPGNFRVGGGFQLREGREKYYDGPLENDYLLREGDLVVTMTDLSRETDTLGYPAFVPAIPNVTCLHNQRLGKVIVKDERRLDQRFLYYVLCSQDYRAEVLAGATGTAVKHTAPTRIESFRFLLPAFGEQQAIAEVLGTLDDKIELNRRMNRTLEELAAGLFKSWFVDFDPVQAKLDTRRPVGVPAAALVHFPEHFEDSKLGVIPKGWRVVRLGDEFEVTMGQSPPGSTYNEEGNGLPFYQGRTDFGFRFPSRRVFCTAPTRTANAGDTLVSVRAPVGDVNMASEVCAIGRGVASVRHKGDARSFTYYQMRALEDEFAVFEGEGTLFGAIGGASFRNLKLVVPNDGVRSTFEAVAGRLDDEIEVNERQTVTLARLRDTLLPALLSGEVALRSTERAIAEVV